MPTQRFKLTIAYRGTAYHGWQRQSVNATWKGPIPPHGQGIPTIQEIVSRTLAEIVRHPVNLVGSSRTDAGVHAKGQVAHFDSDKPQFPPEGMRRAVNHRLPDDILIRSIEPVPDAFDAIGSTLSKRYQYCVWNVLDRPLFFPELAWHWWQPLDREAMHAAAQYFVGEHDFTSFARPGHGRGTSVRTIRSCSVSWRGPRVVVAVEGNGFLWHMVRIITGTLVEIGMKRHPPEYIKQMIQSKDRRAAGATAPPHGLYLQWVRFSNFEMGDTEPGRVAPSREAENPGA
jgi:tRNA pseudouridine38-40 synthase